MFELDPRLAADTFQLGNLGLCELCLMNDATYPWFILVPRVPNATELVDLDEQQQHRLWHESNQLSRFLQQDWSMDKLNIAVLGNVVKQLHIHHVVRHTGDPAWPKPVWGHASPVAYTDTQRMAITQRVEQKLLANISRG
ncbi:HIT family protein [Alteromonas sp. SM 2104]|nr:HIT family protein [Alteromonas oceanisediminis]